MKAKFFDLAKRLSYKSEYDAHRLGAVIVSGNEVIGMGFNKKKTHPRSSTRFNNIHAELSAILNTRQETLDGAVIYVYRETKEGVPALARPCEHCFRLLKAVNIQEMYYTNSFGGFSKERL